MKKQAGLNAAYFHIMGKTDVWMCLEALDKNVEDEDRSAPILVNLGGKANIA